VTSANERVKKIGRVFGDTAYDSRANFNHAGTIGAEPVIKPRANSSGKSKGSYLRGKIAKEFNKDPKGWKENHRVRSEVAGGDIDINVQEKPWRICRVNPFGWNNQRGVVKVSDLQHPDCTEVGRSRE
jgi:hypothetical protein